MGRIKACLNKILSIEKSPTKLAVGCCLGIFLGTSSFLGIQTWIAIPLSWLFGVNLLLVLLVLYLVNNPFTLIPIVVADYAVGHWIIERWLRIDLLKYNPSWVQWVDQKIGPTLHRYLGVTTFCFWCYMLGGLIFGLVCSLPAYPILKAFFNKKIKNQI